jgi:hypothetical protein
MDRNGVLTVTLKLDLNWALVEWYTQQLLSRYNMGISQFTREDIAAAWTAAVQHRMELLAEDGDEFLAHNGTEERFFQVLFGD